MADYHAVVLADLVKDLRAADKDLKGLREAVEQV